MKPQQIVDCDQAFDVLTRGPFSPADSAEHAAVERHLAVCHECRSLAEALRPAVDVLHERTCGAQESLPSYHGFLANLDASWPTSDSGAAAHASQPKQKQTEQQHNDYAQSPTTARTRSAGGWMLAIGIAIGCAIATMFSPVDSAQTPPGQTTRVALAELPLSPICYLERNDWLSNIEHNSAAPAALTPVVAAAKSQLTQPAHSHPAMLHAVPSGWRVQVVDQETACLSTGASQRQ